MNDPGAILTFTSKLVNPFRPDPSVIEIVDIAHALSNTCRYGGHVSEFYSVAQHSVIVSRFFVTPELRLAGLLHDAEEAYMCDIPTPIKRQLDGYDDAAVELRKIIFGKYGIFHDQNMAKVDIADNEVYHLERMSMWEGFGTPPQGRTIVPISPYDAKTWFLSEFNEIMGLLKVGTSKS